MDKGNDYELVHNLVDDMPYQSLNPNFLPMFGSSLKTNLLSIGDEYSRRDTEIVEDDNESQTSSQNDKVDRNPKRRTNTTFSKRKPY